MIDKVQDSVLNVIKERSLDVFKHYGIALHYKNGKYIGCCPFHDDKNPSFSVRATGPKAGQWTCFSCKQKGRDIFAFVAQMEKLDTASDFPKVIRKTAQACNQEWRLDGKEEPEESKNESADAPRMHFTAPTAPPPPPRYFDAESRMMADEVKQTNLYTFLCGLWDATEVMRVMGMYQVGRGHYVNAPRSRFNPTDDWSMNPRPCRLQNSLASSSFPSIDTAGHVHAIKIIPYPATDHHRIKDAQPDKAQMYWIKPMENPGVFFGTHLLAHDPDKPLAIVESEKSAIIGSLYAPQYTWIAVQSLSEFKPGHKMEALVGREIHVFPDTDGLSEWRATTEELRAAGYDIRLRDEVIRMFPAESKLDIGDLIVWEMERRCNNG